jgi:HK97 gp10 family phage protein
MALASGCYGAGALVLALRELPEAVGQKALRETVREAGSELVEKMQDRMPKRTGEAAKSLGLVDIETGDPESAAVAVTPRRGKQFPHAHVVNLLEFGTKKMAAQPTMRPVWDEEGEGLSKKMQDSLWARIQKKARALARKARSVKS